MYTLEKRYVEGFQLDPWLHILHYAEREFLLTHIDNILYEFGKYEFNTIRYSSEGRLQIFWKEGVTEEYRILFSDSGDEISIQQFMEGRD